MKAALDALGALAYGLLGLWAGSLLGLAADRLPRLQSLRPRSRCDWCGHTLALRDRLPVVSYLLLRGRCRFCDAPIGVRTLALELATGVLYALLWLLLGPTLRLLLNTAWVSVLLLVYVVDVEHHLVLSIVILPAILLGILAVPLQLLILPPADLYVAWLARTLGGAVGSLPRLAMVSQGLGLLTGFGLFWLIWRLNPRGMGYGDVRLAAFTGLITGFPGAFATVYGAILLGGLVAIALILRWGKRALKRYIAFAPFLVIAALVVLLLGDQLTAWYLAR